MDWTSSRVGKRVAATRHLLFALGLADAVTPTVANRWRNDRLDCLAGRDQWRCFGAAGERVFRFVAFACVPAQHPLQNDPPLHVAAGRPTAVNWLT